MLWTVLYSRGLKLAFVSAYIRHSTGEGSDELSRALAKASGVSDFIFLGADGNGHSPSWGPPGTRLDAVGRMVEGVLSESNLLVLNTTNSPATFRSDLGHESWIDISAASPALVYHIAEWGVHPEIEVGSDHRLVMATIDQEVEQVATCTCRN